MKGIKRTFVIGGRVISSESRPYCIAEAGINHNGDLQRAKRMIEIAKKVGADAVKFQTFKADEFCGDTNQLFTYQSQGLTVTESMMAMFKRNELTQEQWQYLKKYCDELGITFFSTPQNRSDLDLLLTLGIPVIKIGSDDFTNTPLIESYAKEGLPLILSCGMSDLAEVHQALETAGWFEGASVAILLCTSQYPTPPADVNIHKLTTLQHAFPGLLVGFSDHTRGTLAASLAVALGARIFEKHFTLDHDLPGPDHWFSDEPDELASWLESIRTADLMLGSPYLRPTAQEREMRITARRSIIVLRDINENEVLTDENLGLRRPGNGLPPAMINELMGLKAARSLKRGHLVSRTDVRYESK
jgi:N,N'-diacetyllegionaminate synthase